MLLLCDASECSWHTENTNTAFRDSFFIYISSREYLAIIVGFAFLGGIEQKIILFYPYEVIALCVFYLLQ